MKSMINAIVPAKNEKIIRYGLSLIINPVIPVTRKKAHPKLNVIKSVSLISSKKSKYAETTKIVDKAMQRL